MTYENDIPEFAMQPARLPRISHAEAIYNTEKIIYPEGMLTAVYEFEEDILVPDTKPDMKEILLMDADCNIMPAEKKLAPKTDDLLNITGMISVQTVYIPEGSDEMISISSKVPYKYQWSLNPTDPAEGIFTCQVKNLEYMIINERKFRIKISLEFSGKLFCSREFDFFDSLKDEQLQVKKEKVQISALGLIKNDEIQIDEIFKCKDINNRAETILKQDFVILENYRQVTTEKIVINGFIFCRILYTYIEEGEEEKDANVCQRDERIEFTQFIPLEKDYREKKWDAVKCDFVNNDLTVTLERGDEDSESPHFHLKGNVKTRVELYEMRERDIIVDAYHLHKDFSCKYNKKQISNISDMAVSETSIREIVNLPEGLKASEAVYCEGKTAECQACCEHGRVSVSGTMSVLLLWRDTDGIYHREKLAPDFRGSIDMEKANGNQKAVSKAVIKSSQASMISEKQMEITCSILLCVQTMEQKDIVLLEEPCFNDEFQGKEYPVIIVSAEKGQNLWELAKRYKVAEENIRRVNNIQGDIEKDQRLLIIK